MAGVVGGVAVGRAVHRWRGYVECGVPIEEAGWLEGEADVVAGHDRPVLGPRQVRHAEGVPEHDVGVDQRPVARRPSGEAGAAPKYT